MDLHLKARSGRETTRRALRPTSRARQTAPPSSKQDFALPEGNKTQCRSNNQRQKWQNAFEQFAISIEYPTFLRSRYSPTPDSQRESHWQKSNLKLTQSNLFTSLIHQQHSASTASGAFNRISLKSGQTL